MRCKCCGQEVKEHPLTRLSPKAQIKYFDIWDKEGMCAATTYLIAEFEKYLDEKIKKRNLEAKRKAEANESAQS